MTPYFLLATKNPTSVPSPKENQASKRDDTSSFNIDGLNLGFSGGSKITFGGERNYYEWPFKGNVGYRKDRWNYLQSFHTNPIYGSKGPAASLGSNFRIDRYLQSPGRVDSYLILPLLGASYLTIPKEPHPWTLSAGGIGYGVQAALNSRLSFIGELQFPLEFPVGGNLHVGMEVNIGLNVRL